MTEELKEMLIASFGREPSGWTIWINGPAQCKIRICGLTEEQIQQLRDGHLDITIGYMPDSVAKERIHRAIKEMSDLDRTTTCLMEIAMKADVPLKQLERLYRQYEQWKKDMGR